MASELLRCNVCGKQGNRSHNWEHIGVASGTLMTGLDPDNCQGCFEVMSSNGMAIVDLTALANNRQFRIRKL